MYAAKNIVVSQLEFTLSFLNILNKTKNITKPLMK